jgi:hypothetical protein
MKVKVIEGMKTCTQPNVERERNPVVVAVRREGEATRQKAETSIESENGLVSLISE